MANAKSSSLSQTKAKESSAVVKKCLTLLSSLALEYWLPSGELISRKVEEFICSFKEALELPAKMTTLVRPTYLDNVTIFRMAAMIIMFFDRLQKSPSNDENKLSATTALALNFFFVVVSSCNQKLEIRLKSEVKSNASTNGNDESSHLLEKETSGYSPRRPQSKLRRKKLAFGHDMDVDMNFENDEDSEFSEIEEVVLSTLDVLDISSELSEGDYTNDDSDSSPSENKLITSVIPDSISHMSDSSLKDIDDTLRYLYFDLPIPTIKIMCDWLSINYQLVGFCMDSFGSVFQELVQLLNNLVQIEEDVLISTPQLAEFKYTEKNWQQRFPLSCDWALYKFTALDPVHSKSIDFSKQPLSENEMACCAVESLISFGHFLDKQCSTFNFDAATRSFKLEEAGNENTSLSSNLYCSQLPLASEYKLNEPYSTGSFKNTKNCQTLADSENENHSVSNRKKNDAMKFTVEFLKVSFDLYTSIFL